MQPPTSSPDFHVIAAAWADADGLKTAFATPTARTSYSGGAINGALAAGIRPTARIEISTTAVPGAYNTTDPFIVTGLDYEGRELVEQIKLTASGGNETVSGVKGFAKVTNIESPPHPLGTGSVQIGTGDLQFSPPARGIFSKVAGAIPVYTGAGVAETVTLAVGDKLEAAVSRIAKSAAAFPFIVLR